MGRAQTIVDLVHQYHLKVGAEIGVYDGATCDYVLTNCPDLLWLGVDLWHPLDTGREKDKELGVAPYTMQMMEDAKAKALKVCEKHRGRLALSQMHSYDASLAYADKFFDLVFIDASHDTESVVNDIKAWAKKVKTAGFLMGHDEDWPSVRRALNRVFPRGYEIMRGNCWMVRCL